LPPIWTAHKILGGRTLERPSCGNFMLTAETTVIPASGNQRADAREPLMAWYRQVKAADWATPAEVKRDIRSASILKDGRVVFNLAGNKNGIVVWINYPIGSFTSVSPERTDSMT
jgi:mRNA-degrading endonuclease HigB of HigAB toxin-antitoxin module